MEDKQNNIAFAKKTYQYAEATFKEEITVAYIKAMISWNEIKDEELKIVLGTNHDSDFWCSQDICKLKELYTFLRHFTLLQHINNTIAVLSAATSTLNIKTHRPALNSTKKAVSML